ncbi:hypothetical protein [Blautia sp. HCP3S3_C4]
MEKREYRNNEKPTFSNVIRQNLQEIKDQEFILQIPLRKEVTTVEREVRT